jgi:hypothetical protein
MTNDETGYRPDVHRVVAGLPDGSLTIPISGLDIPTDPSLSDPPEPDTAVITVDEGWYKGLDETTAAQAIQLEQLAALYDQAEKEAAEAAERFEVIKTAVKGILYDLRPSEDTRKVQLRSQHLHAPLEMVHVSGRRQLDRKALELTYPTLDLTPFEKVGNPSWTMRRIKTKS